MHSSQVELNAPYNDTWFGDIEAMLVLERMK